MARARRFGMFVCLLAVCALPARSEDRPDALPAAIVPVFRPPAEFAGDFGPCRSPLRFDDGRPVRTAAEWPARRAEILRYWHGKLGAWPPLLDKPAVEREPAERRESFTQHRIRVQVAEKQTLGGYLLVPDGAGPFPAVLCVFYDPETSAYLVKNPKDPAATRQRAFGYDLVKRGFVALCIGSPGGDARKPDTAGNVLQPLSYLAHVAANCHTALAQMPEVDPARIGVVGHSYGGKWAMFASCLHERFAAAAWSDGGIVFDEPRSNVNYWEPWYLGLDPAVKRKAGLVTADNPRTGAYKAIVDEKHDLHELHALMAPRPFLVSGGSEDPPARWRALNHAVAVNKLLGYANRVAMTNRPAHGPTEESNAAIYAFFEHFLKGEGRPAGGRN